jgi:DNA polymerase-3 subunit epsilon
MSNKLKFIVTLGLLFALATSLFAASVGIFWSTLNEEQKAYLYPLFMEQLGTFIMLGLILLVVLGLLLQTLFRAYVAIPLAMAEDIHTMLNANASHRIKPAGPAELRELAEAINASATRCQELEADVETKIEEAKAFVEEEKNRLAALMSELTQSVLVCNLEGRILLYNTRAKQLFNQPAERKTAAGATSLVGLGRSVFGIVEKNLIVHALDNIAQRIAHEKADPVAHFVTTTKGGLLIRVQMAPVLDKDREVTGYVLMLEDITRTLAKSHSRDVLLQKLTEGTRASLANIRAAVETMQTYPDMDHGRQQQFIGIISNEAEKLSEQIDQTTGDYAESLKAEWPLEDMLGSDLIGALQKRMEHKLGVVAESDAESDALWLRVDSYSVVQALTYISTRLRDEYEVREVKFRLKESGRFARLDMVWNSTAADSETLHNWENQPLIIEGEGIPMTFEEVAEHHGSQAWCQVDKATGVSYCRLLLPVTQPERTWGAAARIESRPEYYDFDLFKAVGKNPELEHTPLVELAYTVFDTETTGLEPSKGDEIISIGAIRIINNRMLYQESFEQLIDPKRGMSQESIRIHGIQPDMLKGKPTIDKVLPVFHQFCEDTVLVAHNAAFDMRFLQLKEESTGIRFAMPVLDTLLLSAVVHPNQELHKLETIAERMGVNVIGRHTSLGDAIVTGEVFLRMVPLLNKMGIHTLGQALEAAQKTYFARLEY